MAGEFGMDVGQAIWSVPLTLAGYMIAGRQKTQGAKNIGRRPDVKSYMRELKKRAGINA